MNPYLLYLVTDDKQNIANEIGIDIYSIPKNVKETLDKDSVLFFV